MMTLTPMNCGRAAKLLPLHAAGDLAGRRARALDAHVSACNECRRAVEEFRAAREWTRLAGEPPEFGEAFYARLRGSVLAEIKRDGRPAAPARRPFFAAPTFQRLAFAASLALALFVGGVSLKSRLRHAADAPPRAESADTTPPPVEIARLTPDSQAATNDSQVSSLPPRETNATRDVVKRATRTKGERAAGSFRRTPTLGRAPQTDATRGFEVVAVATARNVARRNVNAAPLVETARRAEVSRIEIQTADPSIRIIWLSPPAGEDAEPDAARPDR